MQLATSFPGWMPVDPETGESPPNWKAAMLVLLGLFPIVMLEMKYFSPVLAGYALNTSLATFFGNVVSVALTSFLTMPLAVKGFGWWLFPKGNKTATARGVGLLFLFYAAEVFGLWFLIS